MLLHVCAIYGYLMIHYIILYFMITYAILHILTPSYACSPERHCRCGIIRGHWQGMARGLQL